ncbi:hypothetical protein FSP39_014816 [Pinctada imbricata]|uniref:PH domain-containing protein n=1 Tax=Pinctada imbricata TaxID=66713 RepID=A0AA89BQZ4_PINIB|nr:hypothetical protein FSP39_014816 [Pinctada imbricata]
MNKSPTLDISSFDSFAEVNKASRKIAKCGYLFIAPDFDFNNPLDRSRRWQRRLFRLYDDGELTYCVDEDPETIPQGIIDMNKCTAVNDGEKVTSHQFSIEIVTPNKKFYIKGTSKEEFQWWFDVLQVFPSRLTKTKNRRFTMPIFSNKENVQPISTRVPSSSTVSTADTESVTGSRFSVEKVKPKDQQFSTYRGVRNMKHNKTDKHYQEGLRKSSSLHDLTSADMAKSSELQQASRNQSQSSVQGATAGQSSATSRYEDLMYMKKGWLIKQGTSEKDWKKHWFVLTGTSLRYFKDAKAEETNTLDGRDVYREQLPGDSMHSTSTASSGGGDGMLVELLENEVDHLKEQLDSTQKELVKMHESNMDLKTRLQTAVREKDISQVTTMRRQVKEARDVIQKQKAEIENLRSKLDMSVSKLTGTEKALS